MWCRVACLRPGVLQVNCGSCCSSSDLHARWPTQRKLFHPPMCVSKAIWNASILHKAPVSMRAIMPNTAGCAAAAQISRPAAPRAATPAEGTNGAATSAQAPATVSPSSSQACSCDLPALHCPSHLRPAHLCMSGSRLAASAVYQPGRLPSQQRSLASCSAMSWVYASWGTASKPQHAVTSGLSEQDAGEGGVPAEAHACNSLKELAKARCWMAWAASGTHRPAGAFSDTAAAQLTSMTCSMETAAHTCQTGLIAPPSQVGPPATQQQRGEWRDRLGSHWQWSQGVDTVQACQRLTLHPCAITAPGSADPCATPSADWLLGSRPCTLLVTPGCSAC